MKWSEIDFNELKKYRVILVSGPQRSGTTFTAKAIAKALDYWFIDETEFNVDDVKVFDKLCSMNKIVIQCPGMVHRLTDYSNFAALVFMIRPEADIIASQQRIKWEWEQYELQKLEGFDLKAETISAAKYELFYSLIKERFDLAIELDYNSMHEAEGFVPKEQRFNFLAKQTK